MRRNRWNGRVEGRRGGGEGGMAVYLWYDFLSLPVKRLEAGNKGVPFYRHFQRS